MDSNTTQPGMIFKVDEHAAKVRNISYEVVRQVEDAVVGLLGPEQASAQEGIPFDDISKFSMLRIEQALVVIEQHLKCISRTVARLK